jgi:hypothetical protein
LDDILRRAAEIREADTGHFTNPTGGKMRLDSGGLGFFRAPRGTKYHKGVDLLCKPGQEVVSPISGKIVRVARPYAGDANYAGCVIENSRVTVKLFYLLPDPSKIGKLVSAGEVIGTAQDISKKYGGEMQPHVHVEIVEVDPMYFITT